MTAPTAPSRPRPLRVAASIVGGLTALLAGLVGSGQLTAAQGDTLTGVITAAVAALGAFGFVVTTERKVTPVTYPRDDQGRPLVPASTPETGELLDS